MRFRPCIDLHNGTVKQIVGGSLESGGSGPVTNFTATRHAAYYAALYRDDALPGGHVIQLGPGNETAARDALAAYPRGLQIGGGVTPGNAAHWLQAGADKVIVTSYVFREGRIDPARLRELEREVGPDRLVLDLSCRHRGDRYYVVTDRWQTFTNTPLTTGALDDLAAHCSEFLVHAVDVEGTRLGVDPQVVEILAEWHGRPVTYAGGIRSLDDVQWLRQTSGGHLDFTVGSALDLFGGRGVRYADLVGLTRKWEDEDA